MLKNQKRLRSHATIYHFALCYSGWRALPLTLLISLPNSRSHSTELAMARQKSQSPARNSTVENACCRNGMYITAACSKSDNRTAPHSHLLLNSPTNALHSSERALKTLKI